MIESLSHATRKWLPSVVGSAISVITLRTESLDIDPAYGSGNVLTKVHLR